MGDTINDIDLDQLDRLLAVLRDHGVTKARFGGVEIEVALKAETAPLTFEEVDQANAASRPRELTVHDMTFGGGR